MTVARDLKVLIRERMDKTGERYAAARRQILASLHAPVPGEIAEAAEEPSSIRVAPPTWEPVIVRRFRTPEEAKAARPALDDRIMLPVSDFVDITGICEFPENHRVTCQLQTHSGGICDQVYGQGYVMRGKDGRERFVGGFCAKREFRDHVEFALEAARARNDVTVADYVSTLQDLLSDPHLDQRLQTIETRRNELYKQVDAVRECFTYSMLQRIERLTKGTNSTISLAFEYLEKREDRNGKIYTVSKWVPSVVAALVAPRALLKRRFNKVASRLAEANKARNVAEPSIVHSAQTLQTWCANLRGVGECESTLDGIAKDLAAFTDTENLKGLVWLSDTLTGRLATTRSILRVLGHRTVTEEMAQETFDQWEKEMLAAHGNRNYRVP